MVNRNVLPPRMGHGRPNRRRADSNRNIVVSPMLIDRRGPRARYESTGVVSPSYYVLRRAMRMTSPLPSPDDCAVILPADKA